MIKHQLDHLDFFIGDFLEVHAFREVLTDELVRVLDRAAFPGGVGTGKIDGSAKHSRCAAVSDELASVIVRE